MSSLDFFSGIEDMVDFGCGPGTTSKVFVDNNVDLGRIVGIDKFSFLEKYFIDGKKGSTKLQFQTSSFLSQKPFLLCMSYVLNEIEQPPDWISKRKPF